MAAKLKLIPGSTIRWGARRFVVVDYVGLDAVIAREVGKHNLNASRCGSPTQIGPLATGQRGLPMWSPYRKGTVKRFKSLKPLLEMDRTKRTLEKVREVADAVGKHPATIYRWLEAYERSERVSVFCVKAVRMVEKSQPTHVFHSQIAPLLFAFNSWLPAQIRK